MSATKADEKKFAEACAFAAEKIAAAEAVLVGLGAGMSAADGHTYSGARFRENFGDFADKYGIQDMYSGGFYPFPTLAEFWAWWSRQIHLNRYADGPGQAYHALASILQGRNYFILTTNVDHLVQKAGLDKKRLFYTQGDFGLFQCSVPCRQETYDNKEVVEKMVREQRDMKVPAELIPYCPHCGAPMTTNLRIDDRFVQDKGWHEAAERYETFVRENQTGRVLYLEIGVGANTPGIIKYNFWQQTLANPEAFYMTINQDDARFPRDLSGRAAGFQVDAAAFLTGIALDLEEARKAANGKGNTSQDLTPAGTGAGGEP